MPKREGAYRVPFEFDVLPFDEAVAIAQDTGRLPAFASAGCETGPLLETVIEMLDELGRPDEHYDCIQVAGTNGKTSTSRFAAAILNGEGMRAALYTSPQLVRYPERMEIGGSVVSDDAFSRGVSAAVEAGRRVNARRSDAGEAPYTITPFDLLTAAALVIFAEARMDVAVLEVGLGGRWDATSATDPVAVAVTGIGLDHMHILGNTVEQIANEKAAVIKPGRKVVLGEGVHEPGVWRVMDERCRECRVSPVVVAHDLVSAPSKLGGELVFSTETPRARYTATLRKPTYQMQNAACAIALAEAYLDRSLDSEALQRSLIGCPTPGRFDVLREDPLVMIDACHNPQSCENFIASVHEAEPDIENRPTLLIAALSDKDVSGIVDVLIPEFPRIAVTSTSNDRALSCEELRLIVLDKLESLGRGEAGICGVYRSVDKAVAALTEAGEPFVAAGTITLAGEVAGLMGR